MFLQRKASCVSDKIASEGKRIRGWNLRSYSRVNDRERESEEDRERKERERERIRQRERRRERERDRDFNMRRFALVIKRW